MISLKTTSVAALACMTGFVLAVSAASADDYDDRSDWSCPGYRMGHGMGRGKGQERMGYGLRGGRGMMMRFATIDENEDGRISDDEAAANAESVFLAMDADDSGKLTETEFLSIQMGPGVGRNKARRSAMQDRKKARFPKMDVNNDNEVSQAEFLQAAQARFAAADADQDGTVTPWEFRAHRRIF